MGRQLEGKLAVITGASRGIGRATALRLAELGANVAINYRDNQAAANSIQDEVQKLGRKALVLQGDVSQLGQIERFYQQLDDALTAASLPVQIDVLVANAGAIHHAVLEETTESDFDRLFDLNVKGVFFLVQNAVKRMGNGGKIVTVSSGLARFCLPPYIAYGAAKGAVEVMTRYLAHYLGPRGITANCIAPGAIETDMNKEQLKDAHMREMITNMAALKRVGQPEDIADAIAFLASDESRWVSGQRIEASGGGMLGPAM